MSETQAVYEITARLRQRIAELEKSNSALRRKNQQLSKRRAIDSRAKIWLPYWRICKKWLHEKDSELATLKARLGHTLDTVTPTASTPLDRK